MRQGYIDLRTFGVDQFLLYFLSLAENLSAMLSSGYTGLGGEKEGEMQKIPCS